MRRREGVAELEELKRAGLTRKSVAGAMTWYASPGEQ
jgi:hypothetical protein